MSPTTDMLSHSMVYKMIAILYLMKQKCIDNSIEKLIARDCSSLKWEIARKKNMFSLKFSYLVCGGADIQCQTILMLGKLISKVTREVFRIQNTWLSEFHTNLLHYTSIRIRNWSFSNEFCWILTLFSLVATE